MRPPHIPITIVPPERPELGIAAPDDVSQELQDVLLLQRGLIKYSDEYNTY
jgi:hypothetical protein